MRYQGVVQEETMAPSISTNKIPRLAWPAYWAKCHALVCINSYCPPGQPIAPYSPFILSRHETNFSVPLSGRARIRNTEVPLCGPKHENTPTPRFGNLGAKKDCQKRPPLSGPSKFRVFRFSMLSCHGRTKKQSPCVFLSDHEHYPLWPSLYSI